MKSSLIVATIAVSGLCTLVQGELVVHENHGELGPLLLYDPNFGQVIDGQSLDITRDATAQPSIGETPGGSIFFMHILDRSGDFIWMGTGRLTNTVRSQQGTPIIDPDTQQPVDYFGPRDFQQGDVIDESANFVKGWRAIHGFNRYTGTPGVFTINESFTVGIEFDQDGATHYGFASFERAYEIRNGFVRVEITPTRWGYETIAGVGASVVPAPASCGVLMLGAFAGSIRRRR